MSRLLLKRFFNACTCYAGQSFSREIDAELAKLEHEPVGEVDYFEYDNAMHVTYTDAAYRELKVGDKLYTTPQDQSARIAYLSDKVITLGLEAAKACREIVDLEQQLTNIKQQLRETQTGEHEAWANCEHLQHQLAELKAKINDGIRVYAGVCQASQRVVIQNAADSTNATLILDGE